MKKLIEKKNGYSIKLDENDMYLVFSGKKNVGNFNNLKDAQQGITTHQELMKISKEMSSLFKK